MDSERLRTVGASSTKGDASIPRAWAGRSASQWAEWIGVPLLQLHERLPSTNAHLRGLARADVTSFATVVAGEQTAGRGREGRGWFSPPDSGLWFSVLLSLAPDGKAGVLPLAVGVSVALAIERLTGIEIGLKWPNDLLVGSRKLSGVLCESVRDARHGVAVGIGINLRRPSTVPTELVDSAAFLEVEVGRPTPEPELARAVVAELRRWAQPTPSRLAGELRAHWESRDRLEGRSVRLESGIVGIARGVSEEGALRVELPGRTVLDVRSGSVRVRGPEGFGSAQVSTEPEVT